MKIPPQYIHTPRMIELLNKIEANKALLDNAEIPQKIQENLTRQSLLKSSLFSAKIEGNQLTLQEAQRLESLDPKFKERVEIENLLKALSFLRKNPAVELNNQLLFNLHRIVMEGLIPVYQLGKFRKEPSAIFNQAGIAVYVTPSPSKIDSLLSKLYEWANSREEHFIPIKAAAVHLLFEKIHPFLDGNGRIGRLLMQSILSTENYHFHWLLSFEEVLSEKRQNYYYFLDKNDPAEFIEFILEVILEQSERIKEKILSKAPFRKEDLLLPRRKELLEIIRDHTIISFDSLHRRFFAVPPRTLRYDLRKLEQEGFIVKVGVTRGAMYKIKQ